MKTRESEEMYLETILLLKSTKAQVRSVDIVEELGYAKSSVSRGVNLLKKKGYIAMDEAGIITLTKEGENKALSVYDRHRVITEMLTLCGVSQKTAEGDACRIEHVVSDESIEAIKAFLAKKG